MAHRVVAGLKWAKPCHRPQCIPKGRPRGVKAQGLRFENAVGKSALANAVHHPEMLAPFRGQWFEYEDANGRGYCQVDVLLRFRDWHLDGYGVLECKLANVLQGQAQVRELYIPVVEVALGAPCWGIVVARHLDRALRLPRVCTSLREATKVARGGEVAVLHWIGKGAL